MQILHEGSAPLTLMMSKDRLHLANSLDAK